MQVQGDMSLVPIVVCVKFVMAKHAKVIKVDVVPWMELRKDFPFVHIHGVMGCILPVESSLELVVI